MCDSGADLLLHLVVIALKKKAGGNDDISVEEPAVKLCIRVRPI